MRVCLHTIRELGPGYIGGTERLLVELAKELNLVGHEVVVVASGLRGDFDLEGVRVRQVVPDRYRAAYIRQGFANSTFIQTAILGEQPNATGLRAVGAYIDDQLRDVRTDVIHLNSFAAAMFCDATAGAIVTSHENDLEHERSWGAGFLPWMTTAVRSRISRLQEAALLTTPSAHYARFYAEALGLPVRHIRAGIGLASFDRSQRRLAKPPATRLKVLLPARFDPYQKGHDIALDACKVLKGRGVDAQFVFSGVRDDYRARLADFQTQAAARNISDRVTAVRYADIMEGYIDCDLVVSPERFCSYGLSISEAMALGIPTVLSDIPTYREIAEGYGHAVFFRADDPAALADAIQTATQISPSVYEGEAIRFRIANDLRRTAAAFSAAYLQAK